jgi:periplasmic copper chaperone A
LYALDAALPDVSRRAVTGARVPVSDGEPVMDHSTTAPVARPVPSARARRFAARAAGVPAVTVAALLAASGVASAHVSVNPGEAAQGGYTKVAFRVPNERDDAATRKVEIDLPKDHPVASVSTQWMPGWKAVVERTKLDKPLASDDGQITEAVTRITWTAEKEAEIAPGQFQEFNVSLGPLPSDVASLTFKALQTYADGEVVRWIDEQKAGEEEPEHPAPVLTLTPDAASDGHHDSADATAAAVPSAADGAVGSRTDSADSADSAADDSTARALGVAGIVVGAVGALLGAVGLRRRSGSSSPSS